MPWILVGDGDHAMKRQLADGDEVKPHRAGYNADTMEPAFTITQPRARPIPDVISPEFLAALRAHGVIEAYLFGSQSDGTARSDSDVDLLVTFERPMPLFRQMDLAEVLSRTCGRKVDLMTKVDLAFAPYIEPTLVPLPL
jgi:predicted nucleotidyltransferase